MFIQTLETFSLKLGPRHPHTLRLIVNMAYRYEQMGEYSNAQRFYSAVYRSRAATLGPSHPDTIQSQKDLAALDGIYRDMQDYNQTVETFGENHRETAINMLTIAKIYMNSGNCKTAKE
ncbi:hypothetical protein BC936DRAFT_141246, partial [Jimgerdemannia flammicorona]